jgi:hypothetical protein
MKKALLLLSCVVVVICLHINSKKMDNDNRGDVTNAVVMHGDHHHPKVVIKKRKKASVKTQVTSLSPQEFNEFTKNVERTLPLKHSLIDLSDEEVHTTSKSVLDTARKLGLINQQLKSNKLLSAAAVKFYDGCATQEDVLTPIRALCLSHYLKLEMNKGITIDINRYPRQVLNLAIKNLKLL